MKWFRRYSRTTPITLKMLLITLTVGISIWALLDLFVNINITSLFEKQLTERLNSQATLYRYRFGKYVYSYGNLTSLISSQQSIRDYIQKSNWREKGFLKVRYHNRTPDWFPGLSHIRSIAIPRYAILLDSGGRAREVYQSKKQPPPQLLLNPPSNLLRRSSGISYLASIDTEPYLLSTGSITDVNGDLLGKLLLASPLDTDFLLSSQGQHTDNLIIALVRGPENRILVSSAPELLPEGSTLKELYGQHITVRQTFFEYGDSEMTFKFASLVPKAEVDAITNSLVSIVRKFRAIIASVFILSFAMIMYLTSRRIVKVTERISDFSKEIGGEKLSEASKGDQLYILEDNFNSLTEEVLSARETIQRQAEEKTRLIVNQAFEAIITIDSNNIVTSWNPMAEKLFGLTEEDVIGKHNIDIILPDEYKEDIGNSIKAFTDIGCEAISNKPLEIRALHNNGTEFPAEVSISPAKSAGQCFFIVIARDISERIQAEQAIRISEDKFSKAFRSSPALMVISTLAEGTLIDVNETFLKTCKYSKEEVIGRSSLELKIWANPADRATMVNKLTEDGVVYNFESSFRIKDNSIIPVLISSELINIAGTSCLIAVVLELTDRKKLEERLIQSQKMEAVGLLAGGVAHDFNNILTAIIGFSNILLMQRAIKEDSTLRVNVDRILSSADKAAELIRSLLAFSRKQVMKPLPVNINEIVFRLESLLLRLIREEISLRFNLSAEELTVMADSGQIEQVIMNLVTNARDAMPNKGKLTIKTGSLEINREFLSKHGYGEYGKYAFISVVDTGTGMDEATKSKIFEPFFTTKEVGKGSGLGMSVIFGIVKQHSGYINIDSSPGNGTTIQILLPMIQAIRSEIQLVKEEIVPKEGSGNILLAEDDQYVRELTEDILVSFGYKVITASNGIEAIDKFNQNSDSVQMLLLDVIMPGKNGKEVYDEIVRTKPDIKALFVSGYSGTILDEKGISEDELNIVYKPISPQQLLNKIRNVFES